MEGRRLVRIRQGATLGGVCAGLGAYLEIDPTLVRLFFILLAFAEGIGVAVYLLLWIFLPAEDSVSDLDLSERIHENAEEVANSARGLGDSFRTGRFGNSQAATAVGLGLVIIGVIMLADNLTWLSWLNARLIFPVLMVAAGGVMIYRFWQDNR